MSQRRFPAAEHFPRTGQSCVVWGETGPYPWTCSLDLEGSLLDELYLYLENLEDRELEGLLDLDLPVVAFQTLEPNL